MSRSQEPTCASCAFFEDDPQAFEDAFPGILALSSGQGTTKGDQGLCRIHARMVTPGLTCDRHKTQKDT